jgi:hypothetical protein
VPFLPCPETEVRRLALLLHTLLASGFRLVPVYVGLYDIPARVAAGGGVGNYTAVFGKEIDGQRNMSPNVLPLGDMVGISGFSPQFRLRKMRGRFHRSSR